MLPSYLGRDRYRFIIRREHVACVDDRDDGFEGCLPDGGIVIGEGVVEGEYLRPIWRANGHIMGDGADQL